MPLYKFAGNRILTFVENALVGLDLSEWHSGYRAYRVDALADIPFESYSDGFDFDTEIILGLHGAGKSIEEVPIPTYYGDEICYVNGVRYAKDVTADVVRYRLQRMGFGRAEVAGEEEAYELKLSSHTSHAVLLQWITELRPGRVLDVGCSDGQFGAIARNTGRHVTGVDMVKHEGVGERLDAFVEADLNKGLPAEVGTALRLHRRGGRARAHDRPRATARRHRRSTLPWRGDPRQRPQLRPLVPAGQGRRRTFRLRPARPPRPRSRAVLHPS